MHGGAGGGQTLRGIGAFTECSGELSRASSSSSSIGVAVPGGAAAGALPSGEEEGHAILRTSPQLGLLSTRLRADTPQTQNLTLGERVMRSQMLESRCVCKRRFDRTCIDCSFDRGNWRSGCSSAWADQPLCILSVRTRGQAV